jgi:phosphate starvation-inducible membrane PsiE
VIRFWIMTAATFVGVAALIDVVIVMHKSEYTVVVGTLAALVLIVLDVQMYRLAKSQAGRNERPEESSRL